MRRAGVSDTALGRHGAAAAIGSNAGLDSRRAAQDARTPVGSSLLALAKNSISQYNSRLALGDWPCHHPPKRWEIALHPWQRGCWSGPAMARHPLSHSVVKFFPCCCPIRCHGWATGANAILETRCGAGQVSWAPRHPGAATVFLGAYAVLPDTLRPCAI